jgi:response regulator of citrate/malate metabolism
MRHIAIQYVYRYEYQGVNKMIDRMLSLVRVVVIMDALNNEQGRYRLGEIHQFSRISRATCDRYLKVLVSWGLLNQEDAIYKGRPCRAFTVTQEGRELMHIRSM